MSRVPAESPFALFGVRPDAADADVKAAWLEQVQACHPDRLPPEATEAQRHAAEERTKRLNAAWAEVKRLRASGGGRVAGPAASTAASTAGRSGRAPAPDEPRDAADALHRASRAVEDARAALDAYGRVHAQARQSVDVIKRLRDACEVSLKTTAGLDDQARQLHDTLDVRAADAALRAMAGDALGAIRAAREADRPDLRRIGQLRAEAAARAALAQVDAGRRAAAEVVQDTHAQLDRMARRLRPVAREAQDALEKAQAAQKRYKSQLREVGPQIEPAQLAIDRASVAAGRARGFVQAETARLSPAVLGPFRAQAETLNRAAEALTLQRPPAEAVGERAPVQAAAAGRPGLPPVDALSRAVERIRAVALALTAALATVESALLPVVAHAARGPNPFVSGALRRIEAEIAALGPGSPR